MKTETDDGDALFFFILTVAALIFVLIGGVWFLFSQTL